MDSGEARRVVGGQGGAKGRAQNGGVKFERPSHVKLARQTRNHLL